MKKKMTLKNAAKGFWRGYFDFKGVTSRSGYWLGGIVPAVLFILIVLLMLKEIISMGIFLLLLILLVIPSLSMTVRRNRDAGLTGRGFLVLLVVQLLISLFNELALSLAVTFLGLFMNLLVGIVPLLATDYLATDSTNPFTLFFLRSKPMEKKEDDKKDVDSVME